MNDETKSRCAQISTLARSLMVAAELEDPELIVELADEMTLLFNVMRLHARADKELRGA